MYQPAESVQFMAAMGLDELLGFSTQNPALCIL